MDKFEEYFRTTKHYENMLLEIARNQLSVSVFDKNGRKYRNHIVQTAYEVFQHQQAKVEELQEEFAEDERFLKEQIKDKDQKISNLECQQGMDKELIQALQGRSKALQDKVNDLQKQFDQHDKLLLQRNKDVQELYDINVKHAAEKAELKASHHGEVIGHEVHFKKIKQERDELEKRLNSIPFEKIKEAIEGNAMLLYNEFSEDDAYEKARKLIGILEQALKGEGQ